MSSSSTPRPVLGGPSRDLRSRSVAVGAIVGLSALVTMFAGLLFAYAYLRVSMPAAWSDEGAKLVPLPRLVPLLATLLAVIGSVAVWRWPEHVLGLLVGVGSAVPALQTLALKQALAAGLSPGSGPRGSVVFGLTALPAFYLLAFAALGAWRMLAARRSARKDGIERLRAHPAWAWTVHVLAGVWLLIYVSVYVL